MNIHLCGTCAPTHLLRAYVPGLFRPVKCANCQKDVAPADVLSYTLQTLLTAAEEVINLRRRNKELHDEVHQKRVAEFHERKCTMCPKDAALDSVFCNFHARPENR